MKSLLLLILTACIAGAGQLQAQSSSVPYDPNTGRLQKNLSVPTGKTFTSETGSTINLSLGTVTLPDDVVRQGNTFNGPDQLVKLDEAGKLPILDGSNLINVTAPFARAVVANDAARYALTTADARNGTIVFVTATGLYYIVADQTQLSEDDGYIGPLPPAGPVVLQFRQGLAADLDGIVPDSGEPVYATDTDQFFLGDGVTAGSGLKAFAKNFGTRAVPGTNVGGSGTPGTAGSIPRISLSGGNGGSNHASGTGNGGNGGNVTTPVLYFQAGSGGAAGSAGNGGNGGSSTGSNNLIEIISGNGGAGGPTGNGGSPSTFGTIISILQGSGGAGDGGNGGAGGSMLNCFDVRSGNGGAGGSTSGTGGNGGAISGTAFKIYAGNSGAPGTTTGGGTGGGFINNFFNMILGNGGSSAGSTFKGGNGGTAQSSSIRFLTGAGGASGTGGIGGNGGDMGKVITVSGTGGAGSTGAAGGNGGAGGIITFSGGNGSAASGATAGAVGGAGGSLDVSGGAASGSTAGGAGGTLNVAGAGIIAGGSLIVSNGVNTITTSKSGGGYVLTIPNTVAAPLMLDPTVTPSVPTTGGTVTAGAVNQDETLYINPAGTLATLTVNLPGTTARNGQIVRLYFTQAITALTIGAGSGATLNGATATAATQYQTITFQYNAAGTVWFRIL